MVLARQSLPRAEGLAASPTVKYKQRVGKGGPLSCTLGQGAMYAVSCPYLGGDSSRNQSPPKMIQQPSDANPPNQHLTALDADAWIAQGLSGGTCAKLATRQVTGMASSQAGGLDSRLATCAIT